MLRRGVLGRQHFFVEKDRARRMLRVAIPIAGLATLPIVADHDRPDARIKIDHRREPVAVGHHDGVVLGRERAHILREFPVREDLEGTVVAQGRARIAELLIDGTRRDGSIENQRQQHERRDDRETRPDDARPLLERDIRFTEADAERGVRAENPMDLDRLDERKQRQETDERERRPAQERVAADQDQQRADEEPRRVGGRLGEQQRDRTRDLEFANVTSDEREIERDPLMQRVPDDERRVDQRREREAEPEAIAPGRAPFRVERVHDDPEHEREREHAGEQRKTEHDPQDDEIAAPPLVERPDREQHRNGPARKIRPVRRRASEGHREQRRECKSDCGNGAGARIAAREIGRRQGAGDRCDHAAENEAEAHEAGVARAEPGKRPNRPSDCGRMIDVA